MVKLTFEQWKKLVDQAVVALCGLSSDDLPDVDYYTWYSQGVTPKAAAKKAIHLAKTELY